MDCASALERLSERLDGALTPDGVGALESHLAGCEQCRAAAAQMSRLDALCRRELPEPEAAARLAAAVVDRLRSKPIARTPRSWTALVLAVASLAAGVLVIVSVFPRSKEAAIVKGGSAATEIPPRPQAEPAFDVTLARGTVEVRKLPTDPWMPLSLPVDAEQPMGCFLRTTGDGQCEVVCPSGGIVRVDSSSEIQLTAANELNMFRGKVWCRAPETESLKVFACPESAESPLSAATCAPAASMQTALEDDRKMIVVAAADGVEVISGDKDLRLKKGEVLRLSPDEAGVHEAYDLAQETTWMMPLLALRGGRDVEFSTRVSSMLAGIGKTKIGYVHEQTLVELGGTGALPLVAYLRSPESDQDIEKRLAAARIIRQTAPEESIPDLVELLGDVNPDVRIGAAGALERLTAMTFGVSPDEWRTLGPQQTMALDQWRTWLKTSGKSKA